MSYIRDKIKEYCTEETKIPKSKKVSFCKDYIFTKHEHSTGKGTWEYSSVEISKKDDPKVIHTLYRDYRWYGYGAFEQNGKNYVVYSEHYHGNYIFLCLDTWQEFEFNPDKEKPMDHWCWAEIYPSPDGKYLAVCGCYWGGGYHFRLFNIEDIENKKFPLEVLAQEYVFNTVNHHWDDNNFLWDDEVEVRKSDGAILEELPYEEIELAAENNDVGEKFIRRALSIPLLDKENIIGD